MVNVAGVAQELGEARAERDDIGGQCEMRSEDSLETVLHLDQCHRYAGTGVALLGMRFPHSGVDERMLRVADGDGGENVLGAVQDFGISPRPADCTFPGTSACELRRGRTERGAVDNAVVRVAGRADS